MCLQKCHLHHIGYPNARHLQQPNNRAPSKISELLVRSNMIHSHYTRFSAAGNFYVWRSSLNQLLILFLEVVSQFGANFLLRYVNSAKILLSANYINYWSRFWRLRRCMSIWVPLTIPTWTPYSVKVFSFLISIGATFYLFIYFILFLLSLYLRSFADFIGDNYCIVAHLE